MAFDHVISLGFRCYTALQFRRMLIHTVVMPFDWIVAPANGVADAIRNKFEGSLQPENLSSHPSHVLDSKYGFEHWHDYPDVSNPAATQENVLGKRAFLTSRFYKLLRSPDRILFVRQEAPDAGSREDILNLIDAIRAFRTADSFFVLYMSSRVENETNDNFLSVTSPNAEVLPDECWDAAMKSVHSRERIKGYMPSLVKAYEKWPVAIRKPVLKIIGSARKRMAQARLISLRADSTK